MTRLTLEHVKYMPRDLSPGTLYVSKEYAVAGHLCACGCGTKVITPLGPAKWTFSESAGRATLRPSIGNWQLPCRSHYVIKNGNIHWADQWSEEKVAEGRRAEQKRLKAYYATIDRKRTFWHRTWTWICKLVGK